MTQPSVSKASIPVPHVAALMGRNLYVVDSDFRTLTRHVGDSQVLPEPV